MTNEAINPFKIYQAAVIEKSSGKLLECIHIREGETTGKWPTIGRVSFIILDPEIHELRKATTAEIDSRFK
jgi:hypothetical protein